MKDPGETPEQPYAAGPHIPTNAFGRPVPPRLLNIPTDQDPARERAADVAKDKRRHRPASTVAGICLGSIGSAVMNMSLTRASFECGPLLHRQPAAAWCPIVRGPYFDATVWTLVLSFALALIAYWTVYAILHLSDEAGAKLENASASRASRVGP